MRLTDYLPPGPSMSTPPTERVRDMHHNENTLLSRTGFALIICIFISLTLALPTFGHNILKVRNGDAIHFDGNLFNEGTENWQNYEDWSEFIETHPNPKYSHDNTHWHFDIAADQIGGWDTCVADGYNEATDSYNTSKCPGETSDQPPEETNPNSNPTPTQLKPQPEPQPTPTRTPTCHRSSTAQRQRPCRRTRPRRRCC